MKFGGVTILYYPDKKVVERIGTYLSDLDCLWVIDNSETPNEEIKSQLVAIEKIRYCHDGKNCGIAARLNQIAKRALIENFDFLLTFDQDSFFERNVCKAYISCIQDYSEKEKTAMFGIEFIVKYEKQYCSAENVKEVITSGSAINLNNFEKIGGFDENLFIDFVDHEFCYRALIKAFKIIQFKNIFLDHSLGVLRETKTILTSSKRVRQFHSKERLYYMVRNFFYLHGLYNEAYKQELKRHRKDILVRIKNKLLYDEDRIALCKLLFKAYVDFKKGRMGKLKL